MGICHLQGLKHTDIEIGFFMQCAWRFLSSACADSPPFVLNALHSSWCNAWERVPFEKPIEPCHFRLWLYLETYLHREASYGEVSMRTLYPKRWPRIKQSNLGGETDTGRGNVLRRAQGRRKTATGKGEMSKKNHSLWHLVLRPSDSVTGTIGLLSKPLSLWPLLWQSQQTSADCTS